ncbi:MAG: dephospho-CoA kinase [Acidobacteria bacterium]|nr:dephospho-CoA kinase [Acidobacteriota bacterium]
MASTLTPVGLTGGIASGKTTVCRLLEAKGCTIIDADLVAHKLLLRGKPGYEPVVKAFGRDILGDAGEIDRGRLGAEVFGDRSKLEYLNQLLHPKVIRTIGETLEALGHVGEARVIVDASLMIESEFHRNFQRLVLVTCTLEQQVERLMTRNGFTQEQARQRIASQMPLEEKRAFATDIIDNSGTKEKTMIQVDALFVDLKRTAWTTSP